MLKLLYRKGLTMIELIIYMALLAVLLLVFTDIFIASLERKADSEVTSSVELDSRYIVKRLSYEVTKATSVSSPASLGGTSPSLVMNIDADTHTYELSGNNLVLTNSFGTNVLNSNLTAISGLSFRRLGTGEGKTYKVEFTVTSVGVDKQGNESKVVSTTVATR